MPRYQIDYRHAVTGKVTRRTLFAASDSEAAELIALEGLRDVTVRPSLKLAAISPVRPVRPRSGKRIVTEAISRPTDLRAGTDCGGAAWTREESEAFRMQGSPSTWSRSEKQRARKFLSGESHRESFIERQRQKNRVATWERLVEAVNTGRITFSETFTHADLQKRLGVSSLIAMDILKMDLIANRASIRLRTVEGQKKVFCIVMAELERFAA